MASGSTLEENLVTENATLTASGKAPINVVALPSGTDAFQQLTAGLADVYYGSTDQAGFFNTKKPGMVKLASPQIGALPNGVATLHKDKDLHEAIAAAFEAMNANGAYETVLAKWSFQDMNIKFAPAN